MNDSLIQKVIQRQNRNILLIAFLGLAVIAALVVLNLNYWINFISGPAEVDNAALAAAGSPAALARYWINVKGEELLDTGVQYVTTSSSGGTRTVDASYYALLFNERVLIVKMEGEPSADKLVNNLTGWLSEFTSAEDAEIVQKSIADYPTLKGLILPFKLDTSDFRTGGILGLVLGGILGLVCLWQVITVLGRISDPNSHPILKKLARFGPLDFILPRIESDLAVPHPISGKLHLTNSWLVYAGSTNFVATRYEDVAWIYKHVLTRKSYGITVGETFTVMAYDRFGELLSFEAGPKEPACDDLLGAILARVPWAVAGYTSELAQAWSKDRPGFLAAVERRKTETQAALA